MAEDAGVKQARYRAGQSVFVNDTHSWIGTVTMVRLRMEDEAHVYTIRDNRNGDHIEIRPERDLTELETIEE